MRCVHGSNVYWGIVYETSPDSQISSKLTVRQTWPISGVAKNVSCLQSPYHNGGVLIDWQG